MIRLGKETEQALVRYVATLGMNRAGEHKKRALSWVILPLNNALL